MKRKITVPVLALTLVMLMGGKGVKATDVIKHGIFTEEEMKPTITEPQSVEEIEKVLLHLILEDGFSNTLTYSSLTGEQVIKMVNVNFNKAFTNVFNKYPEHFSYVNKFNASIVSTNKKTDLTITLSHSTLTTDQINSMKEESYEKADKVIDNLIETKKITHAMSESQKAKVLFEWIVDNTEYDQSFATNSYNTYGQLIKGKAVCHGYTGSYNLLAKRLGLDVKGVVGIATNQTGKTERHIWTLANLDGIESYIDTTWGDPIGGSIDYNYFMATEEFMRKTHNWEIE